MVSAKRGDIEMLLQEVSIGLEMGGYTRWWKKLQEQGRSLWSCRQGRTTFFLWSLLSIPNMFIWTIIFEQYAGWRNENSALSRATPKLEEHGRTFFLFKEEKEHALHWPLPLLCGFVYMERIYVQTLVVCPIHKQALLAYDSCRILALWTFLLIGPFGLNRDEWSSFYFMIF